MADGSKMGIFRQIAAAIDPTGAFKVTGGGSGNAVGTRQYLKNGQSIAATTEYSFVTSTASAAGAALGTTSADGWPAGKSYKITALTIAVTNDANLRLMVKTRQSGSTSGLSTTNVLRLDGAGADPMTVAALRKHGHPLFYLQRDISTSDTANPTTGAFGDGQYIIALRPGVVLELPNGGDVCLSNISTTTAYTVSAQIITSEIIP